jgi:hypothetical protein
MPWLFPMIDALPNWAIYALFACGVVLVTVGVVAVVFRLVQAWRRFWWRLVHQAEIDHQRMKAAAERQAGEWKP